MLDTELTKRAYQIACEAHRGQCDKNGKPYILHPLAVAENFDDEILAAAALLHDVLEDNGQCTPAWLLGSGIPPEAVHLVEILTRKPDEPYFDYIRRVKQDPDATHIKIADLQHNLDPHRLAPLIQDHPGLSRRYVKALRILTDESQ